MEPRKVFRINEVNRHCYKRVKAFIGTEIRHSKIVCIQCRLNFCPQEFLSMLFGCLGMG